MVRRVRPSDIAAIKTALTSASRTAWGTAHIVTMSMLPTEVVATATTRIPTTVPAFRQYASVEQDSIKGHLDGLPAAAPHESDRFQNQDASRS